MKTKGPLGGEAEGLSASGRTPTVSDAGRRDDPQMDRRGVLEAERNFRRVAGYRALTNSTPYCVRMTQRSIVELIIEGKPPK